MWLKITPKPGRPRAHHDSFLICGKLPVAQEKNSLGKSSKQLLESNEKHDFVPHNRQSNIAFQKAEKVVFVFFGVVSNVACLRFEK